MPFCNKRYYVYTHRLDPPLPHLSYIQDYVLSKTHLLLDQLATLVYILVAIAPPFYTNEQ